MYIYVLKHLLLVLSSNLPKLVTDPINERYICIFINNLPLPELWL